MEKTPHLDNFCAVQVPHPLNILEVRGVAKTPERSKKDSFGAIGYSLYSLTIVAKLSILDVYGDFRCASGSLRYYKLYIKGSRSLVLE